MKKWLKYIIAGIIIVTVCFAYAHIDKANNIYDTKTDNSSYVSVNIFADSYISQTFQCSEDSMDGIAAKIFRNGTSEEGELIYSIQDESGQELTKGGFSINNIKSGKINLIKFSEPIEGSNNKFFTVYFRQKGLAENESLGIYYDPVGEKTGELKVNDEKIEGTMVFRTITHRFDMETFIVVLGFVVYFVLFFKILYRLFS
ncbi:hypothetical protein [Sporofaciens musculi]|uniref:hypothetical protein n=1 Tax=Sporofaciens musculi TaxID=2681861 RepID=UPI00259FFE25|nr:hypothetical protein [Sporofaciens musculi]